MYTGESGQDLHERIQVKICGITQPEDALVCAAWGADAAGLVFYPKSPRFVTVNRAAQITSMLPSHVTSVGVFVNESFETIMETAYHCGLFAVQLHGRETPELVEKLREKGLCVIKCLYVNGTPNIKEACQYNASSFLVECSTGVLPGGNAKTWDWSLARQFAKNHPTIIAGGLSPQNATQAIDSARPDAVDVSSAVESSPGKKDTQKVRDFIYAVRLCNISNQTRRIF
ncbi:MAG: phosphoribosylanthranilate isomerase [Desulfobacteraceae bacterium]|nr:phosphoribosylanthranilate isomerase [Desulfobacteraceae bacterium]MCF8093792.1 phosphoribosylanthranilate isomerase [Desulfobacteraceae bacterium]